MKQHETNNSSVILFGTNFNKKIPTHLEYHGGQEAKAQKTTRLITPLKYRYLGNQDERLRLRKFGSDTMVPVVFKLIPAKSHIKILLCA